MRRNVFRKLKGIKVKVIRGFLPSPLLRCYMTMFISSFILNTYMVRYAKVIVSLRLH